MKKINQRKGMAALMALGTVLLFLGVYGVWEGWLRIRRVRSQ
jgi:hypothetical protein